MLLWYKIFLFEKQEKSSFILGYNNKTKFMPQGIHFLPKQTDKYCKQLSLYDYRRHTQKKKVGRHSECWGKSGQERKGLSEEWHLIRNLNHLKVWIKQVLENRAVINLSLLCLKLAKSRIKSKILIETSDVSHQKWTVTTSYKLANTAQNDSMKLTNEKEMMS